MLEIEPGSIEAHILALAREYSGNTGASLDDYVYRDLGIGGSDAVEFYETIENKFATDLRPITETTGDAAGGWFSKPRQKVVPRDPSLKEIVGHIVGTGGFTSS